MMFADAAGLLQTECFLAILLVAIISTAIAFIGSQSGRYGIAFFCCALAPIAFAALVVGGCIYWWQHPAAVHLRDFAPDDFFKCGALALPFILAGLDSLSRLKRNRRKANRPKNN